MIFVFDPGLFAIVFLSGRGSAFRARDAGWPKSSYFLLLLPGLNPFYFCALASMPGRRPDTEPLVAVAA